MDVMPTKQATATVAEHAQGHPAPSDIVSRLNMKCGPKGEFTYDHVPGTEDEAQKVVNQAWEDLSTVKNPWAPSAARHAAHKRLKLLMAPKDHKKLGRALPPRVWGAEGTLMRHEPQAIRPPRTLRATRDTRHTTVSRVCAFSAGPKQSGADDDGPGGDPPDAARLAASITRFEPQHAARLEPPTARRGGLLPAGEYLSTTRVRQVIGARA
jgi:hypothetical protein